MGTGRFEGYREYRIEHLFERFHKPLLAFFKRRAYKEDPEDLTQDVFVRLASHPNLQNVAHMDAYVFQIASNLLRDQQRSAQTRRQDLHRSFEEISAEANLPEALVEEIDPERVLLAKTAVAALNTAIANMPQRTRDIFLLYRVERMRQQDIAKLLGISVSSVEKHVVKAITILAKVRGA